MLTASNTLSGRAKTLPAHSLASWLEPEGILLDVEPRDRRHALELAAQEFARPSFDT